MYRLLGLRSGVKNEINTACTVNSFLPRSELKLCQLIQFIIGDHQTGVLNGR